MEKIKEILAGMEEMPSETVLTIECLLKQVEKYPALRDVLQEIISSSLEEIQQELYNRGYTYDYDENQPIFD